MKKLENLGENLVVELGFKVDQARNQKKNFGCLVRAKTVSKEDKGEEKEFGISNLNLALSKILEPILQLSSILRFYWYFKMACKDISPHLISSPRCVSVCAWLGD